MKSKVLAFLFCLSIGLCGADYFRRTAPVFNLAVVPVETCKPVANTATLANPVLSITNGGIGTTRDYRLSATTATSTTLAVVSQR